LAEDLKDELDEKNQDKSICTPIGPAISLDGTLKPPRPIYFYHPDHLGSSTFLTDANGIAYQFFINLPFGETMAEQLPATYYRTPL
jgi:hypothetical protein